MNMSKFLIFLVILLGLLITRWSAQAESKRTTAPTAIELTATSKIVGELFDRDLAAAKTPEQKSAVARKLLALTDQENDSPAGMYCLLTKCLDVACEAGDTPTALKAVDRLTGRFDVDDGAINTTTLQALSRTADPVRFEADLNPRIDTEVNRAVRADRFDRARQLAGVAETTAKRLRANDLARRWMLRLGGIEETDRSFIAIKPALEVLTTRPSDPAGNQVVGQYRCFVTGDWVVGLPLLRRGTNAAMKSLATAETASDSQSPSMTQIADGWWAIAEYQTGRPQRQIRAHAALLYTTAAPTLTGLDRIKAEKRSVVLNNDADGLADDPTHGLAKIAGRWNVTYDNRQSAEYDIAADGTVIVLAASYRDPGAILHATYTDGWFEMDLKSLGRKERFRLDGENLVIQHWGTDKLTSPEKSLHAAGRRAAN